MIREKQAVPGDRTPESEPGGEDRGLHVTVIFTSPHATLAALKEAASLASRLNAKISLLVFQIVPYPAPINTPPVPVDWNERRCKAIAGQSAVDINILVYLCRDREETLRDVLSRPSLVVLGAEKHWWHFTRERRLAQTLRKSGHEVLLIETE